MQGWIKTGAISKAKLPKLWDYFADVVDWSHWGMDGAPGAAASPPALGLRAAVAPSEPARTVRAFLRPRISSRK